MFKAGEKKKNNFHHMFLLYLHGYIVFCVLRNKWVMSSPALSPTSAAAIVKWTHLQWQLEFVLVVFPSSWMAFHFSCMPPPCFCLRAIPITIKPFGRIMLSKHCLLYKGRKNSHVQMLDKGKKHSWQEWKGWKHSTKVMTQPANTLENNCFPRPSSPLFWISLTTNPLAVYDIWHLHHSEGGMQPSLLLN